MNTLWMVLGVIGYFLAIVITKAYIKSYRWTYLSDEVDAYTLGILWPFYIAYRLLGWPLSKASSFIEDQMEKSKNSKEEAKKQAKLRVPSQTDPEYQEAEQEVEHLLTRDKERHHSL